MQPDSLKIVVENTKQSINLFGIFIDPIIFTVLTPIIIFIAGQWLLRRNDKIKERNKLHDIRLYFYSQVETLIGAVSKQKQHIQDFIKQLKEEKIQGLIFTLSTDFQIKHLNELPKTDLFRVIVSKEKKTRENRLALFWNCQLSFDLVEWQSNNFKNRFEYVFTHCSEYEKSWNESITFVGKFHDRWIVDAVNKQINIDTDPFLNGFWQIYHEWAKDEFYRDMYVAEKKLIIPLIEHCRKLPQNYYALLLLEELLVAKAAVDNHRNIRNVSIEEFGNYLSQLDKIYSDLTSYLRKLKETQRY